MKTLLKVVSSTFPNIALMQISVADMCHEDLLCHFESAYKFIKEGVTRGSILVHCYHGVSFKNFLELLFFLCILFKLNIDLDGRVLGGHGLRNVQGK